MSRPSIFTVRYFTFWNVMLNSLRGRRLSQAVVPRRPPEPGRNFWKLTLSSGRRVLSVALPLRQLRLQFADALLKLFDQGLNLLLGESLLDVLGAVDVPGFDGED